MSKPIVNSNYILKFTVTGAPSIPGVPLDGVITTPPSSDVSVGGGAAFSGPLTVTGTLVFLPPAFVPMTPPGGVVTLTIVPTGTKDSINGKPVVLEGDRSIEMPWTGTAAATSSSPIPCAGTISVEILSAGQTTVSGS